MSHSARFISSVISCLLSVTALTAAVFPAAHAEQSEVTMNVNIYDNIISEESKAENSEVSAVDDEPLNVFDIYDAHQKYVNASEQPPVQTTPPPAPSIYRKADGIDVAQWQGDIDWSKVKASGVEYAIIRAGYGKFASQEDPKFRQNMNAARSVGLDCGTYWYSYALSVEEAYQEADACYEVIKNYDFQYPVYFDIEDQSQSTLSAAQTSAIIEAFCSRLQAKGYYVGLYSYANLLTTKVFDYVLNKYDVWVANVDVASPEFKGNYGMWQYSWKGRINGINADVDLDHCYINYPYIISPETYTGPVSQQPGVTITSPETPYIVNTGVAKGIDVSEWQGEIDWKKVKASGINFAIIRAGYGMYENQKDKYFEKNIKAAHDAGIQCGVYWYSYATNTADAQKEAELFYNTIKNYKFEYPIYFDIESAALNGLNASQVSQITDTFCSYMESKKYYIGIRSYTSFLNTKFEPYIFQKYAVWISQYDVSAPQYSGTYGLWQYNGTGRVDGISTHVNLDYAYNDFLSIMQYNHLNGY